MELRKRSVASWALGALLLAALGTVGKALEPSQGLLGSRTPLLPALRDAVALLSDAEAGGGHGAAAVLKVRAVSSVKAFSQWLCFNRRQD